MDLLRVFSYVVFTVIIAVGAWGWRGAWTGTGDYYSKHAEALRPMWLWGDRALLRLLRALPATYVVTLSVLLYMVASDLAARYPSMDLLRSAALFLVLVAVMSAGAVTLLGRPSFLVAPPMRNAPDLAAVLLPKADDSAAEPN